MFLKDFLETLVSVGNIDYKIIPSEVYPDRYYRLILIINKVDVPTIQIPINKKDEYLIDDYIINDFIMKLKNKNLDSDIINKIINNIT